MASEGEIIYYCRYVKKNATAVAGAVRAVIRRRTTKMQNPGGADYPGPSETRIGKKSVYVEIWGVRDLVLAALLGSTAENIVIGIHGLAGALQKITVKTVDLVDPLGQMEIPDADSGGRLTLSGIGGEAQWGTSDTFATMVAGAAEP